MLIASLLSVKWVLAGIALALVVLIVAVLVSSRRFASETAELVSELRAGEGTPGPFAFAEIEGLPEPVRRYFGLVLREGQPRLRHVVVRQRGTFRVDPSEAGWRDFEATEHFSAEPPGFVWDARIRMAPFLSVRVRDGYVHGRGSMQARLSSLVALVDGRDRRELDLGALQRYLAEAVWIPTALLPRNGVTWSEVDDRSALATLSDAGNEVTLRFRFDAEGRIVEVYAPDRFREVDGSYVPTPWRGTFREYEERGGVLVPIEGEVSWILSEAPHPYWRGHIESIDYDE